MTQRFPIYLAMICSSILAAGCNLSSPPECITGKTKCENHPDIANSIGAVCGTEQVWHHYACPDVCNEAGTDCKSLDNIPACSVEGEQKCVDTDTASIRLTCINQKWLPAFCAPGGSCSDNTCDLVSKCENGDQFCVYIDALNQSVSATCIDNQWVSQYCPSDLACDGNTCGVAQNDDVTQCGSTKVNCSSSVTGWQNGVCHDGQCEARECINGYHLYENTCEINDETHCGSHENSCTPGVSVENSTAVACVPETGVCEVTGCDSGYHIYENTCELNDETHCGSHENSCTPGVSVENSTNVACVLETGVCEVTGCDSGYHIYENTCELNDETHCGSHENSCTPGVSVENSTSVACVPETGVCEVTQCVAGYHIYNNDCEKDDNDHCGSHEDTCTTTMFAGSESVSCDTGTCIITACSGDYIKTDNVCLERDCTEDEEKCVNENNIGSMYKCINNVWEKQETCTSNYSCNANNTACGKCKNNATKCTNKSNIGTVYTCKTGNWSATTNCETTSCSGKVCGECKNEDTQCENNSSKIGQQSTCASGQWGEAVSCETTSCNGKVCGECENLDSKCEEDTTTKIGTEYECSNGTWGSGKSCVKRSCLFNLWTENKMCGYCLDGTTECTDEDGLLTSYRQICSGGDTYLSDKNFCKTDVPHAIGACLNKTDCGGFKCILPHAKAFDTSSGSCVATDCDDGYTLCNGLCIDKQIDNDNCGGCGNQCTGLAMCINGTCTDTPTCGDGNYYLARQIVNPVTSETSTINAFCINSVAMFNRVRDSINNGEHFPSDNNDHAYILTSDLTLDPLTFIPIGTESTPFENSFFLGNNKTIKLDDNTIIVKSDCYGLFGVTKQAYIENLNLYIKIQDTASNIKIGGLAGSITDTYILHSKIYPTIDFNYETDYVGGAVGVLSGTSYIYDVVVKDASIKTRAGGAQCIGGIIGETDDKTKNTIIERSVFQGIIDFYDSDYVGGIAGRIRSTSLSDCIASGAVRGYYYMGGLLGSSKSSTISNCYAACALDSYGGDAHYGGYVAALIGLSETTTIVNSSATVPKGEKSYTKPFVKTQSSTTNTIKNSYAMGKISSFGIDVKKTSVDNCYSVATLSDETMVNSITINSSGSIYTVNTSDGKELIESLESPWRNLTCTLDLGDGAKKYRIPVSTAMVPDFCEEQIRGGTMGLFETSCGFVVTILQWLS